MLVNLENSFASPIEFGSRRETFTEVRRSVGMSPTVDIGLIQNSLAGQKQAKLQRIVH